MQHQAAAKPEAPTNPFRDAVPWQVDRPPVEFVDDLCPDEPTEQGVTGLDRRVYDAFAAHCFNETECFVTQLRVARLLGVVRETVNRSVTRLRRAGWLKIIERRRQRGSRWWHNVYAVLGPINVGFQTVARIVRDAHRHRRFWTPDHTKSGVRGRRCGCKHCRRPRGGPSTAMSEVRKARDRLRPRGVNWRDEMARVLRRRGASQAAVDAVYDLPHRLAPLASARAVPASAGRG